MRKTIAQLRRVIILQTKTQVKLTIKPNPRRTVLLHYDPLTNIELPAVNYHRILNILLHNVLRLLTHRIVQYILQLRHTFNPPPPR